jgi:MFS family permease
MLTKPLLFLRIFLEGITQSHWAMEPILFPLIIYSMTGKNFYTGLVFGLMGLIAMVVFPTVGKYMDKNSSIKGYKIAFSLYTLALLICFLSEGLILFTIGALMLSLGKTFNGLCAAKIEIRNIKDENRGEYLSYIKGYDTLTAALTCLIIGLLLKFFSPQYILLIFALFTAAGCIVGFRIFSLKSKKY